MKRTPLFVANWKMYKNQGETRAFLISFLDKISSHSVALQAEYSILAQAGLLPAIQRCWNEELSLQAQKKGLNLSWGAQNAHWEKEGAWTGELSPLLAKELGSTYILAGHSERRQFFGETNNSAAKRAASAHEHGMKAIFCVGENLEERESEKVFEVLTKQCDALVHVLPAMPAEGFVVAYEPVWAIGTGKTATPQQAEEVHHFLRRYFARVWGGEKSSRELKIIYGGSVKPQNSGELLSCANIDGALIGGAGLNPSSFLEIAVNAFKC